MNSNKEKKTKQGGNLEAALAIMLLAVILFAVVFAVVFVVDLTTTEPDTSNENGHPSEDPAVSTAIFSNGTVPQIPTADSNTQEASLYSDYGVIIDVANGKVLAGKDADAQFEPASMTKVMTLIVACEKLTQADLDKRLTYTEYYDTYDYHGLDLALSTIEPGYHVILKDMLYGIGVKSAGDCTLMIADYTYGSEAAFVEAMNRKVAELGLTKTRFADASGNDVDASGTKYAEGEGNITTAKEMAVIMAYAMQCSMIRDILSAESYPFYSYYTDQNGVEQKDTKFTHYSTLFVQRMDKYKEFYNKTFKLGTVDDLMGKTGYLTPPDRSYLVCGATGKTTGNSYVVVVGNTNRFAYTMKDVKDLFDTYAK